jgi:hypothetical protein
VHDHISYAVNLLSCFNKCYYYYYREKIRVGRSEIDFFLNIFFMVLAFFCGAICSRVPTSILTRVAYFLLTNLGNLVQ